jgi:hypothetical protein
MDISGYFRKFPRIFFKDLSRNLKTIPNIFFMDFF